MFQWLPRLFGQSAEPSLADEGSDRSLLEQFIASKDEAAFARLVERHGGMVLGVSRRVLGDHQEAEDAFQATFLVLARKPPSLAGSGATLAGWLHTVAYRIALRARSHLARQRALERSVAAMQPSETRASEADWSDVRQVIERGSEPAAREVPPAVHSLPP
jgi:RNA polymerase sigma factor (sigma-70 family)